MNTREAILNTIDVCDSVVMAYLNDLTDEELMLRPNPQSNHVAWQLGHIIASEREMMTAAGFDMPALPAGFAEAYTPETTASDDPAQFHTKMEYLAAGAEQREATLAALNKLSEADFDKPTPAPMNEYAPTLGAMFNIIGMHPLMHAGQFVPIRRQLGKPIAI